LKKYNFRKNERKKKKSLSDKEGQKKTDIDAVFYRLFRYIFNCEDDEIHW